MSIALIGWMDEEVAAGRMDPKTAFEMLAANTVEELELRDKQYEEAIVLLKKTGIMLIEQKMEAMDAKEREESLLRTIFQTWSYLGTYTNDADDATHAKRLLQNCLLVRGPEGMKAAVKKRLLAPKRRTRFSVLYDYSLFAGALCFIEHNLATANYAMALLWMVPVIWCAIDIAKDAANR